MSIDSSPQHPDFNGRAGFLVFLLLLSPCLVWSQSEAPPAAVEVASVRQVEMAATRWLPGTVMGRYDSKIAAEVDGRVEQVLDVGDRVAQGERLAEIEPLILSLQVREMEAAIQPLQARLDFLEREVRRLSVLAEKNNAAKSRLDEVSSELKQKEGELMVARARLAQSRDQLGRTRIKAPFAGVVSERYRSPGERVEAGDPVVRLVDTGNLEIQVRVPQEVVAQLQASQVITVRDSESQTDSVLRTWVPVGDSISRLYELRLSFDRSDWMSGHAVKVSVPVSSTRTVLAVPRDALVIRQNNISIFVVDSGDTARFVAVKTGISSGDLIEIEGDVMAGDRVVIRGNERLRPGQQVNIQNSLATK